MILPKYKFFYVIGDSTTITIAYILSLWLFSLFQEEQIPIEDYLLLGIGCLIITSLSIIVFQYNDLYKINVFTANYFQVYKLIISMIIVIIIVIIIAIIFLFIVNPHSEYMSRLLILVFLIFSLLLLIFSRLFFLRKFFYLLRRTPIIKRRVAIYGAGKNGQLLASKLLMDRLLGIEVAGFIDDKQIDQQDSGNMFLNIPLLGNLQSISTIVKEYNINEIILAIDNIAHQRLFEIIDVLKSLNITIRISSSILEIIPSKIFIERYLDFPLIDIRSISCKLYFLFSKRIIDVIIAIFILLLLFPLMIIISCIIFFTSRGPIFFIQPRVGKNGKIFQFYKFRSMRIGSENDLKRKKRAMDFIKGIHPKKESTKVVNHYNITKVGHFLRKYSLDEIPNLLNVLIGDMSLIGPRPFVIYEWESLCDWQRRRSGIKPGCTGIWQVFGRSEVSFTDSIILDLFYMNNMSPWLDIKIFIKTFPIIYKGKGGL